MYLSKYLIEELRKFFTEKERSALAKQKRSLANNIMECEEDWPICYYTLFKKSMYHKSPTYHLHITGSILDNYNPTHFGADRNYDRSTVDQTEVEEIQNGDEAQKKRFIEDQLLIVRTRHYCKFMTPADEILGKINQQRTKMVEMVAQFENMNKVRGVGSADKLNDSYVTSDTNQRMGRNGALAPGSRRQIQSPEGRRGHRRSQISYSNSPGREPREENAALSQSIYQLNELKKSKAHPINSN